MPTDAQSANNPNAGPEPVTAKPNRVREKTYEAPTVPQSVEKAIAALPEKTAEDKVSEDMPAVVDAIKKRF